MARETYVRHVDDIDRTEIPEGKGETISYAFDGAAYEIDLNDKNAKAFRKLLEPYLAVSRRADRASGRPQRGAAAGKKARAYDLADLRVWAEKNNVTVPARGRIKSDVVEKYLASRG